MVFTESLCLLQGSFLKRPVVIGRANYGLYILHRILMKDAKIFKPLLSDCNNLSTVFDKNFRTSCNHATRQLSFNLWHKRVGLGHVPYKRMRLLPLNVDFKDVQQDIPCNVCPKAKQQRLPFQSSSISTTSPFELIYVDTWGPYHTKTHAGHRFFLTIVDDFTRATWTHLMVAKDEAMGLIKSFVKMAQT